jgi:hypothetical protein
VGRGLVIALLVLAATAMGAVRGPTAASSNREDQMRDQIGQFLNMERTNRGLRPLPIDPDLAASAQAWSEHNRDAGCETNCHSTHAEGEIIAWGDVNARSGKLMVAWMQSGNHRNIVLYPDATAMGVGVACKSGGGEVYATVQFYDVYRPVAPTDQDPIASSEEWGSPCEGIEGPVPPTSTSTPTSHRTSSTTTTRPRPTTTTSPPRKNTTPTTAAPTPPRPKAPAAPTVTAPPVVVTTTTPTTAPPPTTTTTSPRIALRADGTGVTADPTATTTDEATLFAESAATPANAEPAWIAIVVVVLLLSGMRVGAQLQELRAARRLEDS